MKKYSLSLIVKIPVIVFIAFVIVLGNEMRLGINRYIKNTLQTDAEATKLNLDKFSKSYVETIAMHQVDLNSDKFQKIYRNAIGGDSSKIKCLIDDQGNILDISREGRTEPYLGIVLKKYKDVENLPVYFNLSSLSYDQIKQLEELLRQYIDGENYVSLTLLGHEVDYNLIDNEIEDIQIKELRINNRVIIKNDLKGDTVTIQGIVNSYENYNVEIYYYNLLRDNLKGTAQSESKIKSTVIDYDNMIEGLKKNISNDFQSFIQNSSDLPPTNSADYFLLKPYDYNGKHYSTIGMRLIDWSRLIDQDSETANDKQILDQLTAGYVLVTQEYENLTMNATKQFMLDNSSTYFIAFILVGIMSLVVGYSIVMPIRRIETTAKHIARKEFDYPIDMTRHDELGDLSRNINMMSQELEKTINNLYQEVERVQKLEQVRKEFVSNFTHEIKTPLGIINGFSELVELEQDEQKRNEYIHIIQNETKRINELVKAMLDLSQLESQNISLNLEEFDLLDIVNETIDSMMYLIEKKNIHLKTNMISSMIQADRFKIEMVIDNFISNALRYTEEGKTIYIEVDQHHFSIENEGAHIPEEDMEKIWLTFHKVDKARNEKGTGLGLSICKAALDRHHFQYGVKNTTKGVLFYFEF